MFELERDEFHLTGQNCLIVIPEHDGVGDGLGRACPVAWLPAGRVGCACYSQNNFEHVSCEVGPVE